MGRRTCKKACPCPVFSIENSSGDWVTGGIKQPNGWTGNAIIYIAKRSGNLFRKGVLFGKYKLDLLMVLFEKSRAEKLGSTEGEIELCEEDNRSTSCRPSYPQIKSVRTGD